MDSSCLKILWCMDMLHKKGKGAGKHNHEFYHYIYVREGQGHAVIDGQGVPLVSHNLYIFNPLVFHEFKADEDMRLYEIKFRVSDARLIEALSQLNTVVMTVGEDAERILAHLAAETDEEDAWSDTYRRTLLLELLILLCRQARVERSGTDPYGLSEVVRYMRTHCGEDLRNGDLAAMLHMEKTYFIKRFGERYGVPPRRYLLALRMERAVALLENSDTAVSRIAEFCGFHSIHHFSNAFSARFGISPTQYRGKHTK